MKLTLHEAVRLNLSDKAIFALHEAGELDIDSGAERILDSPTWLVIIPHTFEALVTYGKGAKWAPPQPPRGKPYFVMYDKQKHFIIFINKKTGEKYLNHEDVTVDSNDRRVEPEEFSNILYSIFSEITDIEGFGKIGSD